MTDHRWTPSEYEVTESLRAHYAAPSDPGYWSALESRILAHVARGAQVEGMVVRVRRHRPAGARRRGHPRVRRRRGGGAHPAPRRAQRVRERHLRVTAVHRDRRARLVADGDATLDYMLSH